MRTVKIQGGLGNQLFGLAFAHSVATLTGEGAALDISSFAGDRYGHRFVLHDLAQTLGLTLVHRPWLSSRIAGQLLRVVPVGSFVTEGRAPDDPRALERLVARGRYFNGYWQNEAYIASPRLLRRAVRAFLEARGGAPAAHDLVIHYRSYADELRPERRVTPGAGYFRRAVETIEAVGGRVEEVVLVSDAPDLALRAMGDLAGRVRVVQGGDAYADLALMLRARRLILTNSSFSWWGGYCGEARTIAYPSRGALFHYPAPSGRFVCV